MLVLQMDAANGHHIPTHLVMKETCALRDEGYVTHHRVLLTPQVSAGFSSGKCISDVTEDDYAIACQ